MRRYLQHAAILSQQKDNQKALDNALVAKKQLKILAVQLLSLSSDQITAQNPSLDFLRDPRLKFFLEKFVSEV